MTIDLTKPIALLLAVGVVAFFVGGFLVSADVAYTDCLGLAGSRRGAALQSYLCSPRLLGGDWRDHYVFVWLWAMPTLLAAPALYRIVRKSFF